MSGAEDLIQLRKTRGKLAEKQENFQDKVKK
jgi:hypothetical protein